MDRQIEPDTGEKLTPPQAGRRRVTRRAVLKWSVGAAAGLSAAWVLKRHLGDSTTPVPLTAAETFPGDAPSDDLWQLWQNRGWAKEAYHYRKLGRNVQCGVCPNHCLLAPGDRSHCRTKVNRDGVLYTLAYGNPCAVHVDPIEKKPLFHFLPGTKSFSLATAGCVLRCLNCQNWDISQRKPEETKDPRGADLRPGDESAPSGTVPMEKLSLFPADLAAAAQATGCPTISYTYSEPIAYYEYAFDACKAARAKGVRNVLVTCGYIEEQPLRDWLVYVDAAHVDLKGFDDAVYRKLNSGRLDPVLNTLKTAKAMGVWVEVVNLVVPTYTDKLEVIKRMCGWLTENLGPDCPLHFSRFVPMHKLAYLTPTPVEVLLQARSAAMSAGLRYVYVGNVPGVPEVLDTFCPRCRKAVVRRDIFAVTALDIQDGKCKFCQTAIPGVWSA